MAARAGLRVSALNAEMITDTAMVTANCWYIRPVIPGMNAVGTKTATRIRAMATTGPRHFLHGLQGGLARRQPLLDVVLDGLHDHDGVVHHQPDGQHQPEQRQRVDGEAQQREHRERPHQRHRHGQQRDQGRPERPAGR